MGKKHCDTLGCDQGHHYATDLTENHEIYYTSPVCNGPVERGGTPSNFHKDVSYWKTRIIGLP